MRAEQSSQCAPPPYGRLPFMLRCNGRERQVNGKMRWQAAVRVPGEHKFATPNNPTRSQDCHGGELSLLFLRVVTACGIVGEERTASILRAGAGNSFYRV